MEAHLEHYRQRRGLLEPRDELPSELLVEEVAKVPAGQQCGHG